MTRNCILNGAEREFGSWVYPSKMRFYYSKGDWHWSLSMFRGDGNRMCHESLGISRNAVSVKSRVGALENTRIKWVNLDSILGGKEDHTRSQKN